MTFLLPKIAHFLKLMLSHFDKTAPDVGLLAEVRISSVENLLRPEILLGGVTEQLRGTVRSAGDFHEVQEPFADLGTDRGADMDPDKITAANAGATALAARSILGPCAWCFSQRGRKRGRQSI